MSRSTYVVTPTDTRLPAVRLVAADLVELGERVAEYFARNRRLAKNVTYQAEVGDERGCIRQQGLPRPLFFTISRDAA